MSDNKDSVSAGRLKIFISESGIPMCGETIKNSIEIIQGVRVKDNYFAIGSLDTHPDDLEWHEQGEIIFLPPGWTVEYEERMSEGWVPSYNDPDNRGWAKPAEPEKVARLIPSVSGIVATGIPVFEKFSLHESHDTIATTSSEQPYRLHEAVAEINEKMPNLFGGKDPTAEIIEERKGSEKSEITEEQWKKYTDENSKEPQNSSNRDWYWYLRGLSEGYGQAEFEGHKRKGNEIIPEREAFTRDDVKNLMAIAERAGYREGLKAKLAAQDKTIEQLKIDASNYAYQMDIAKRERDTAEAWKESQMKLWGPVIDYCQENGEKLGIKLGESISDYVLKLLKA